MKKHIQSCYSNKQIKMQLWRIFLLTLCCLWSYTIKKEGLEKEFRILEVESKKEESQEINRIIILDISKQSDLMPVYILKNKLNLKQETAQARLFLFHLMFLLDDIGFCIIIGLPNIITDALFFTFHLNSYCVYGEDIIAFWIYQATVSLLNNLPLFVTLALLSA